MTLGIGKAREELIVGADDQPARLSGTGRPWAMRLDSSATTGRPAVNASCTSREM